MEFETEHQLTEFREIQEQYFDEEGKPYSGKASGFILDRMLKLINQMESELNKILVIFKDGTWIECEHGHRAEEYEQDNNYLTTIK